MTKLPQIPGYRIIKKLGQGGMADVYLGIQEKLQRHVAVKVMIPSLFRDEQFSKRFIKEAQTAAQLNHPHIITIHDVGEAGESHYIVMEFLEESLSDRLKQRGYLPPKEALAIVKMIASALDYAHRKGFIHRDIKPDNIMFRADGNVVLVDFGIARTMDSTTHLTRTGMSIGTPHYMSPEQCKGEKSDGRSDIYSLGVQLYEILTGEVPYTAENTAGIIIKQIQDPVPRLPKHLNLYQHLIDKMMAKERGDRIQTGTELIRFIDGFITAQQFMPPPAMVPEDSTVTLEEATLPTAVQPGIGRSATRLEKKAGKRWLVPGLAAGAAVILAVVLIFLLSPKAGPVEDRSSIPVQQNLHPPVKNDEARTQPSLDEEPADSAPDKANPPEKEIEAGDSDIKPGGEDSGGGEKENRQEPETIPTQQSPPPEKKSPVTVKRVEEPKKQEVKSAKIELVNLLELPPALRQDYHTTMQRRQIPVLDARFRVHGQIALDLFINETGRMTVTSVKDLLTVIPALRQKQVVNVIKRGINSISLSPPRDKDGQRVRFNWRITYKVGKYLNKIILTKQ